MELLYSKKDSSIPDPVLGIYGGDLGIDLRFPKKELKIQPGSGSVIDSGIRIKLPTLSDLFKSFDSHMAHIFKSWPPHFYWEDYNHILWDFLSHNLKFGCVLKSKSGLSINSNIENGAGVVDPNFEGFIRVKLYNHGPEPHHFYYGAKMVQMIFPICLVFSKLIEADLGPPTSERGDKGLGSSGV